MLLRNPRLQRIIASGLLVQFFTQFAWPTVSYALTAGPTAPEATSFEPVDTTDMVNLQSGDLTYNIPLLEVPGPEGGYPLSLAYHAGIQPEVEASWVGLGWSLNPGAVTRNVNGYADDHNDVAQVTRDYWVGGVYQSYSAGLAVGLGNVASVSAGLTFSHDTYRGFGVGPYASVGMGIGGDKSPVGISAGYRSDGLGNNSVSASVGVSTKSAVSLGARVGVSSNFSSVSANAGAGISTAGTSLLGASISSSGGGVSLATGGRAIGISNDKAGRISTQSEGMSLDLPILPGLAVELGYAYERYWSDETTIAATNGALYFPDYSTYANNPSLLDDHAYDTYRLLDSDQNIVDSPDADKLSGGSFAEYDAYNVVAQGLSGSMRPYAFQQALYSRNRHDNNNKILIQDKPLSWSNKALGFRFDNDFSNRYQQTNGTFTSAYNGTSYLFDPSPARGDGNGMGYDASSGRLAGSKHIEWYTNQAIAQNQAPGFVNTDALGFTRSTDAGMANQIGGFSITNASGVTYHFALPAYSFNELIYTAPIRKEDNSLYPDGDTYNRLRKPGKYAYTWYLTAMTGPDYVDRNGNGLVDAADWGYWVKFNYGKWSDRYGWRNPAQGYRLDIDANQKTFSKGVKEVYYLNSVSTRSHTAIFEKELRYDGKSSTLNDAEVAATHATGQFTIKPDPTNTGFSIDNSTNTKAYLYYNTVAADTVHTITYPCNSLKLSNIYLLRNEDVPLSLASAAGDYVTGTYNVANPADSPVKTGSNNAVGGPWTSVTKTLASQFGQNVIDKIDVDQVRQSLTQKAIRVVSLNHDYSLSAKTPNSYDELKNLSGKLTLKSLVFKGVSGSNTLPATAFSYELENSQIKAMGLSVTMNTADATATLGSINVTSGTPPVIGDILKYVDGASTYYCTVLQLSSSASTTQFDVRFLGSAGNTPRNGSFQATTTKNPPYVANNHDWWGMFKSDFDPALVGVSEGIGRRTTDVSNQASDVWSLRTITSPLGSKISINYQGDQYRRPVLTKPKMICNTYAQCTEGSIPLKTPFTKQQARSLFASVLGGTMTGQFKTLLFTGIVRICTSRSGTNYSYAYSFANRVPVTVQSVDDYKIQVSDDRGGQVYKRASITDQIGSHQNTLEYSLLTDGYLEFQDADGNATPSLPGGGLRVESINVKAGNEAKKTSYVYDNIVTTGNLNSSTSGSTSYEPDAFLTVSDLNSRNLDVPEAMRRLYKKTYMNALPKLLAFAREVPAPGVMYETATVKESLTKSNGIEISVPGFWTYRFNVFDLSMLGIVASQAIVSNQVNRLTGRQIAIKDMTSRIGSLRSTTHWAAVGKKLSESINHYLHDDASAGYNGATTEDGSTNYLNQLAAFNYQGVIQESFGDSRAVKHDNDDDYDQKVVMSKREVYPTILTSTSAVDYLTGVTTNTQTLAYDFFSGDPVRTVMVDGYGNRMLTETVPAYRKYPAMGLKLGNANNRQMLTQVATTTTYKVDAANTAVGVVAASVQTWSNQVPVIGLTSSAPEQAGLQAGSNGVGNVWRPWQNYAWLPTGSTTDGLTPLTGSNSFAPYDFTGQANPAPWKLTSQVTLYNPYSNALEAKDMNGIYAATKMGFDHTKVLMSGGPAAYQELAYSGAEESKAAGDYFSGGVAVTWAPGSSATDAGGPWGTGDVEVSPAYAHTGTSSLRVGPYKHGFAYLPNVNASDPSKFYLDPAKSYRASVWTNDAGGYLYFILDGQQTGIAASTLKKTADGWYLLDLVIPPLGVGHTNFRVSCYNGTSNSVYFDDFRFEPLNAQANSYVYDKLTGQVTHILSNDNLYTRYEYTSDGKLKRVSRETFAYGGQRVAEHFYHVSGALDAASLDVLSSTVTVNVPEAAEPVAITYDNGDGTGYRAMSTAAKPYSFTAFPASPQWVKVRIKDNQGNVRELVKRLN